MAKKKVTKTKATEIDRPKLPKTLSALQLMRTIKSGNDSVIHKALDEAKKECDKAGMETLLAKVMLHIGDVNRQHKMLSELGIKSPTGGAQEREVFRSVLRWWAENMKESFAANIAAIADFTVLENLFYVANKTDRKTGKLISKEAVTPDREIVYEFLIGEIRKGRNVSLIAKHLPKLSTGKNRVTKKVVFPKGGKTEYSWTLPKGKAWVTINGVKVDGQKVTLKKGDVVCYPREKQSFTLERQRIIGDWVRGFCKKIGWTIKQYKEFRKLQNTSEQLMSSKEITRMPKSDFMKFLDRLTSGQRFRVAKSLCYKEGESLKPRPKWGDLGAWYVEWEKNQTVVAEKLRVAASTDDAVSKKELMKELKVKATGMQTVDLLAKMFKRDGSVTTEMIDNTYQSMVEKMDIIANVFPVIDGSSSMNLMLGNTRGSFPIDKNLAHLTRWDVAAAMCITFSTRNPVPEFRNTFGWFSCDFKIIGKSKYVNNAPNHYVSAKPFTKRVNEYNVLSELKTFSQNFKSITECNPGYVSSTNMFATIDYFVKLVTDTKMDVESLPNAIVFITDNERNTGKNVKEAIAHANSIGWNPLLIFWGIEALPNGMKEEIKGVNNVLLIGGFSESVLSQILRRIKDGAIDAETELWAIAEDPRYSIVK